MSRHRLPGILGLCGLLLTSLVAGTVSPAAQAPARAAGGVITGLREEILHLFSSEAVRIATAPIRWRRCLS